ncbi:hypothetical protein AKJ63_00295 [candidate division MSBL1 archaeon SCGC-AAA259D18]|uniref:Stage II sporulation protein M n=1 Tax=candidate division MSBL1 archaeon SCGC-AAA259D18 TaxID=1698262 RepID=A0A133UCL8_9EURY|nr:hypothetical protein AKJ63_00295 [candidate division MSBL1 archaeon SCGC-AAA259D18]
MDNKIYSSNQTYGMKLKKFPQRPQISEILGPARKNWRPLKKFEEGKKTKVKILQWLTAVAVISIRLLGINMDEASPLKERLVESLGKNYPRAVGRNLRLIAIVTTIFLLASGIAILSNQIGDNPVNQAVKDFTEPSRKFMEEEAQVERSPLGWTGFYLKNNLVSAIEIIGLGVAFGVFSLYSLLMNGLTAGYVISTSGYSALETSSLLLPHGVFELTGYVLATSCGVRLGIGSIKSLANRETEPLKKAGNSIADLIPASILLIIIAGLIEGSLHVIPVLNSAAIQVGLVGASLTSFVILLFWTGGKLIRTGDR